MQNRIWTNNNPPELAQDTGDAIASKVGAFAPLKGRVFSRIWTASVLSNFGQLILGVAAAWKMTRLTSSASMVALVQTAMMLPFLPGKLPICLTGAVILAAGAKTAFGINALCYLPLILAFYLWKRGHVPSRLPPERIDRAIVSGGGAMSSILRPSEKS
jgi:hypothetical protein